MWNGKITEELKKLAREYANQHHGVSPDSYDELCYDAMGYEEFAGYIKEALRNGKELPDVVP